MAERRTILVVDDDPAILSGLEQLLEAEGFAVKCAADGIRAVRSAVTALPDLILLDVNLPRLSGFEVARRLREQGCTATIIMLSARGEQVDKIIGLESGAVDYITKPFDPREVLARIRAHLRSRVSASQMPSGQQSGAGKRRILSIMFTDMVDFSKTMGQDERKALLKLRVQNLRIAKAAGRWSGRIVEVIGDAYVVTFENALHAVECGIAIQKSLTLYNRRKSLSDKVQVRIGIHMGDVTESGGKIRGDAVNVAARLQQISAAGCITMSGSVYESVKGVIKGPITRNGTRRVKNIRQVITVYEMRS